MARKAKKDAASVTSEVVGYIVRLCGTRKYLHLNPLDSDFWGKKDGAFQFRSVYDAAQFAPYFTHDKAYEIIPVYLEV